MANDSSLHFYRNFIEEPAKIEILDHYVSLIKKESMEFKWDKTKSRFVRQQ